MQQKATVPIIIIAVVAVIGLVVFMGKTFMAGPATHDPKETVLPSFIDPVTHKPKVGGQSSSGSIPTPGRGSPSGSPSGAPK